MSPREPARLGFTQYLTNHKMPQIAPQLDHLVVAARTLTDAVDWCVETLGVVPGPGGSHPLMGTHNRLIPIGSAGYPSAYLELIAIDPSATPTKSSDDARWFDLDDANLQERLIKHGPQLIHWVARVDDLTLALQICNQHRVDIGGAVTASRPTPEGILSWQISIRGDGALQIDGVMPTLISWGATHPTNAMNNLGVSLTHVDLQHPEASRLNALWRDLGAQQDSFITSEAGINVQLTTPKGLVTLSS
jgi:hypothetical protein